MIPDHIGSIASHAADELIRHTVYHYHSLLGDTGDIVIITRTVYNVFCRLFNICGLIHKGRGIARACTDALFPAAEDGADDTGATGGAQHIYLGVVHHDICLFHSRIGDRHNEVIGPAGLFNGLCHQLNCAGRGLVSIRMRAEDHRIACGNHDNRVVDYGLRGVSGGGQRTNHAEGRVFIESRSTVIRFVVRIEHLHRGRQIETCFELNNLIVIIAHSGLFQLHAGQFLNVGGTVFNNGVGNTLAILQR